MSFDPTIQGVKNYIEARDGTRLGLWATYADAAATSPVDGTGGSPSSTFAASVDSSIRRENAFVWTKSAANRQGEGFSYAFSIDAADKGKVLQVSFEYLISSGTYADDDMSVWIYDVTSAALIQPAPYLIKNSGIIEKFAVEFQTASNSTSYRLIIHTGSTSALAYTVKFDNFILGPQAKLYGSAVTDPVVYTPILSNFGNGTAALSYNRVGSRVKIKGTLIVGSSLPTGVFQFSLPSGLSADYTTNTVGFINTDAYQRVGIATGGSGAGYYTAAIVRANTSMTNFQMEGATTTYTGVEASWDTTHPLTWAAGQTITIDMEVPIQGWSSSQVFSQDADTRVVAAIYSGTPTGTLAASNNLMTFPTKSQDTHAQYSSGLYTIPVSGYYRCKARSVVGGTTTSGTSFYQISVAKNGSAVTASLKYASGTVEIEQEIDDLIYFDAGQTASFLSNTNIASPTFSSTVRNYMSIERISGPSQIAASESVSALYTGAPATGTFNSSFNTVTYGTKVKDSHNAYSGGVYTIPTSGVYDISAQLLTLTTLTANQLVQLGVSINGAAPTYKTHYNATASASSAIVPFNVQSIPLLAGSTVAIQALTEGATNSFSSTAGNSYFSITRTGNF